MELTTETSIIVQGDKDHPSAQDVPEGDKQESKNELDRTSLLRQSVTLREGLRRTFSAPTKLPSHIRIGRSRKKHPDKNIQTKPQEDSGQTSIKMDYLKVPTKKQWKLKKQREVGRTPKTLFAAIYQPQDKTQKRSVKHSLRKRHHVLLIVIFAIIVIIIIIVSVLKVKKHPHQQHLTG